jgi:hypothetical protein
MSQLPVCCAPTKASAMGNAPPKTSFIHHAMDASLIARHARTNSAHSVCGSSCDGLWSTHRWNMPGMAPYTTLQTNSAGVLQPSTNWLRAREAAAALCRRDSGPVFTVGAGLALAVLCVDLRKFPLELAPAEDPLLRSCAVDDDPFRAGGIGTAPGLCVVCTRMDSPGFRAGLVCACDGMRVLGRPRERRLSVPRRGREGTRMQTGQCVARDRATGRATVISTPAGNGTSLLPQRRERHDELLGQKTGANSFPVGKSGRRRTRRV